MPPRAPMLHVSRALRARALRTIVLYIARVLRVLVPHVPRTLRAPVLHMPCALRGLVPHVLCASRTLCLIWPRALHFMSPFFLRTLLSRTLRTQSPNITFCTLEFPCLRLLLFYSFANCDFLG